MVSCEVLAWTVEPVECQPAMHRVRRGWTCEKEGAASMRVTQNCAVVWPYVYAICVCERRLSPRDAERLLT